jgi:hypothetical protein
MQLIATSLLVAAVSIGVADAAAKKGWTAKQRSALLEFYTSNPLTWNVAGNSNPCTWSTANIKCSLVGSAQVIEYVERVHVAEGMRHFLAAAGDALADGGQGFA